jgi:hypothetical protein
MTWHWHDDEITPHVPLRHAHDGYPDHRHGEDFDLERWVQWQPVDGVCDEREYDPAITADFAVPPRFDLIIDLVDGSPSFIKRQVTT